jgi:AraC-like DNA-binding protein
VKTDSLPGLEVHVERGRAALRVVARAPDAQPELLVEATFSGGADGVPLRITQGNLAKGSLTRAFSREAIARHPALSAVLRLIADEVDVCDGTHRTASSDRADSAALLPFLFRSLLVYVARISTSVPLPKWGRPLRDLRIEKAITLLNSDICRRWTVELLARAVGLSRPVFARQFARALGLSPMRYLTQRRMQVAAALLHGSDAALAEVARRVGYESEFAFNRAFKRHYDVPPGVYRQRPIVALASVARMAA